MHRQALALKTLPDPLHKVLKEAIKTANYVKSRTLNTGIFRKPCADMGLDHLKLLCYTKVRWLSKGNVVAGIFELREELKEFLIMQNQHQLESNLKDNAFMCRLFYLVDVFDQLNRLNLKLQ